MHVSTQITTIIQLYTLCDNISVFWQQNSNDEMLALIF